MSSPNQGRLPGPGPPIFISLRIEFEIKTKQEGNRTMKQQLKGLDENMLRLALKNIEKKKAAAKISPMRKKESPPPASEEKKPPPERPTKTIPVGDVVTRIWANKNDLEEITWSIDQRRRRSDGRGGAVCKTFRREHLQDAIRGLYKASVWIKKTERRLRWRRLFL